VQIAHCEMRTECTAKDILTVESWWLASLQELRKQLGESHSSALPVVYSMQVSQQQE